MRLLLPAIVRSVAWLTGAQVINMLLPVLVLPYLLRRLGAAEFGVYVFCQATVAMAVIFVDWGFSISATQRIAAGAKDPASVTAIFSNVTSAKIFLGAIVSAVLLTLAAWVPNLRHHQVVLIATVPLLWGTVVFPQWLFQGLERMGLMTICLLGARLVTIIFTFLLVHGPNDTWIAALVNASSLVLAGFVAAVLIVIHRLAGWRTPALRDILGTLGDGWHVFLSSLATSFYATANSVVLGSLASTGEVGLFSIADRIRTLAQAPITPLSGAAFPRMGRLAGSDNDAAIRLAARLLAALILVTLPISIVTYMFAAPLVRLVAGPGYEGAAEVLRILAPVPVILAFNTVAGLQLMLPFGMKRAFSRCLITGAIANLALMVALAPTLGARGGGIAVLATEIGVTVAMVLCLSLRRPWRE